MCLNSQNLTNNRFPPALSDRKIESKNEPAKNDREVNEYEFIISTISQHRRFEDIPEVPEEISSTNITPRRPEDQNEEIGEIEIINVNKKSPFVRKLQLNSINVGSFIINFIFNLNIFY